MKLEKLLFIAILCLKGEQGKDWEYLERLWVKNDAWLTVWAQLMSIRMN